MPSAADDIVAAIAATAGERGGAIRFDRFMELALYGQHGFYMQAGRAGRRGDFITSAEVGPLFGAVIARWVRSEYDRLGAPDDFTVVEVGAGPGTLARAITAHWATDPSVPPLRYVAVEVSESQRSSHPTTVDSRSQMPAEPFVGVVIANELLDNLPFRLMVFDSGWREAFVAHDGGRFVEVLRPIDDPPAWLPADAPLGARVPWQQAAHDWVDGARQLLAGGSVLVFDYMTPRTADVARMGWRDWLRTYRGHERGAHYLSDPGGQDITAQVVVDQLSEPDQVRTQAQFLQLWGIDELVEQGRQAWAAAAAAPTLAALTMRSRVREAEALCDPSGLGGFLSLVYRAPAAKQ